MELRKKLISVAALAFAMALSTGIAVSASAEGEPVFDGTFNISATSVRISDREEDGKNTSGLRFKTDVIPNDETADYQSSAYCYTTITVNATVGEETKDWSANVAADLWREDGSGWNTVLANIPQESYTSSVTAQSFIKVDENTVYATPAVSSSIALTASKAMQEGDQSAKLLDYTAGVVTEVTLDKSAVTTTLGAGAIALKATTAPAGYGVVWSSSDPTVATVDTNGNVTAVGVGEATITATMSGQSATCVVTVEDVAPVDVVDFENGKNGIIGVEPNGLYTTDGIVEKNGNKVLQMTMNSNAGAFSISKAFMNYAVYEKSALSIEFTISADKPITAVTRMHDAVIAWYGEEGSFDCWQFGGCQYVIQQDGSVRVTIPASAYKASFGAEGDLVRTNVGGAVEGTPYYFGVRMTMATEDGQMNAGSVFYLDDFKVNRKPDAPADVIDFEDGLNWYVGTDANRMITVNGVVDYEDNKALSMTTSSGTTAFSISHDYMNYAFYQKKALSVSFLVKGAAVTGAYGAGIAWYNGVGNFDRWDCNLGGMPTVEAQEDGSYKVTIFANNYKTYFDKDGNKIAGFGGETTGTPYYYGVRLLGVASGATFYLDNFTINYPPVPADVIDFEDGKNLFLGIDPNANMTVNGVVDYNGGKALKATANRSAWALSFSSAYLQYAFYELGAESISFDVAVEGRVIGDASASRACPIAWYTSSNAYDYWAKAGVELENKQDGTLKVTFFASNYKSFFNDNGEWIGGTLGGEDASKGYFYGVMLKMNDADGAQIGGGSTVYYDNFTINYAAAE